MHDKPWVRVVLAGIVGTIGIGLVVIAFAWPASRIAPRDVPIGVAAPNAAVVEGIAKQLDAAHPGAFEVTAYASEASAREAIQDREIYGAIVATGQPPTVVTAPAASPAVAQLLDGVAGALSGAQPVTGTAIVPLPADDPRGTGFGAGALPMVLGGLVAGVISYLLFTTLGRRLAALGLIAVGAASLAAFELGPWLGILPGNYVAVAAVMTLGFLAGGGAVLGLASVLGRAGLGLGAAISMLLGNPLSGASSAPELLPSGWGAFGQYLPPGALTSLLRSVAYFDGAAGLRPAVVLAVWALAGLALAVLGARTSAAKTARPATVPEPIRS